MRLLTMRSDRGERCAVVVGGDVVDVQDALSATGKDVPAQVRALLARPDWRELVASVVEQGLGNRIPRAEVEIGPVISDPQKILFLGGNTWSHQHEAAPFTNGEPPQRPMVSAKTTNAINGPYDEIIQPHGTHAMDYEAELCVVIGARARRVATSEVASVIAGYTVANDVSDREYQLSTWEPNSFYRTHYLGKSFDGFCPCGPELVTRDDLPADLSGLRVRCIVNGEVRQDGPLSELIFSVEDAVSYISQFITLEPGDLLLMGSPAGVGHFENPPAYVRPGGVVRCEIDGIGYIENHVVAEEDANASSAVAVAASE
jgi:2-keto-4-pentenoate hydratase/2-oxohepta-3-ene-1,7-dioic acid hydratase in catechol pathway